MSKAILVMDMPEKCIDCPFHWEVGMRDETGDIFNFCQILNKSTNGYSKEHICPLQKVPERKYTTSIDASVLGRTCGWNECLNEILGE